MKAIRREGRFRKDLKRVTRRGYNLSHLFAILTLLVNDEPLPSSANPHPLRGDYIGYLECHIQSDWLLVYKVTDDEVVLARTGTHADLFG